MNTLKTSLIYAFIFGCGLLALAIGQMIGEVIANELITHSRNVLITPIPGSSRDYHYLTPTPTAKPSPRIELISTQTTPTKEEILQEIQRVWEAGGAGVHDWQTAQRIATCESGLRPHVVSKTSDTGVFQINQVHKQPVEKLKDYKFNISFAYKLYQRNGWKDWRYSQKCWSAGPKKGV